MYQLNDFEIWREHSRELLREAEDGRLAQRLKAPRPKKRQGYFGDGVRRRVALLLSTMD
jgi:hypothetical protein